MKILLKNVNLLNPFENLEISDTDLLIVDGKIEKRGTISEKEYPDAKVFELPGKYVVPGFFDMHVHLREPGREDKESIRSGSISAAAGGFTGIACMPNTDPAIDSAEVVSFIRQESKDNIVDVYPIGAATLGRKGEIISPMAELNEAGVVGFSDDGVAIKTAGILKRVLEYSAMYNLPVIDHCEDESLGGGCMNESPTSTLLGMHGIPPVSEEIIVNRDIQMAEYTGGNLHIAHISTKRAVEMVREAKKKGIKVTAEVTPHHFTLDDDNLKTYDTNYKMSPPLRRREDIEELIKGLADGTIDCIASDHAPHTNEEKEVEFEYAPNGITGLETEIGLSLSELYHKKHLTLSQIVEKLAINPRKILNLPVPLLKEGEKAELTILDLDEIWTVDVTKHKSKSKNSPFHNRLLTGKALGIVNNGKMYFKNELVK